jgi:phage terminase large subunit-like protein
VNDLRRGQQQPTLLHEPPGAVDWRLSDIALDWAAEVAGYTLDPWQAWLTRWTFARRRDGLWAARDVGLEVCRQQGKNIWLEVVELVALCEFGDRLIIHSSHRSDTSHEHFLSLRERIQNNDNLMDLMPTWRHNNGFITQNGNESIEFASGARLLFKARAKSSGRGPRPQKIVLDEALVLEDGAVGAMAPGLSAQKNAQILYASSSPRSDSAVLHRLRKRAMEPEDDDRFFYAAWNNPADIAVKDRDAWYRVNPSLGFGRMTEDSLMANRLTLSPGEFMREHLGVPEEPDDLDNVVDPDHWASLADPHSTIASNHQLALDVDIHRKWASFAAAGRRADGKAHVEVFHRQPGTDWVLERAVQAHRESKLPVRILSGSPAASFIPLLAERNVPVEEVSPGDHARAVGQFLDAVENKELAHLGDPALTAALSGAVLRASAGDASVWARKTSKVDISSLVAVTVALGGVAAPTFGLFVAVT